MYINVRKQMNSFEKNEIKIVVAMETLIHIINLEVKVIYIKNQL